MAGGSACKEEVAAYAMPVPLWFGKPRAPKPHKVAKFIRSSNLRK